MTDQEIIYLDESVRVYAHRSTIEGFCRTAIRQGIELGDKIPPVEVARLDPNGEAVYILDGTHRASAYFMQKEPIPAVVVQVDVPESDIMHMCPIGGVRCNFDLDDYKRRKLKDPNYR
ncbi:hypothetical protein A2160_01735 [Candidatus Beckwithbacteria bacterium RBG_13_42_9]|uniref:ParB/Sulfiredoxin domain-containing protein n=1 Tax=Candidatus Beckwithbacteria bacterium RBG_13_42_9 TaxID=1797457 RepID=A0A1F5E3V9_9BACT|nr:MAG: hypothetical protein A2160_01735 [Candidatus Beckwithbacteria bacterium RBG_13_42_9]